jgi:hypothetical protein
LKMTKNSWKILKCTQNILKMYQNFENMPKIFL